MNESLADNIQELSESHASELTRRQRRELDFYEKFARQVEKYDVSFAPVLGHERRPWNPVWFMYEKAQELYDGGARTLLDIGCGTGSATIPLARIGYQVTGIDISPASVQLATDAAIRHGLSDRTTIQIGVAERLDFPNETFDIVTGFDVLHHVEIEPTVAECLRVLKTGGTAIFKEWMQVPVLDRFRQLPPLRWFFPTGSSLKREVTQDERKLTSRDLAKIRTACQELEVFRFRVLARFNRLLALGDGRASPLEKLDARLTHAMPSLRHVGGAAVLVLKKH